MFCSNCGKTLKPGENQCPHCGMPVSESPFSSMSYTAAPPPENARPERPARQSEDGYAPVTRTTYTQMDEREQGDVYSRTTYRAPLSEEENAPQEPGPAANQPGQGESAPMDGESTGQDLSSAVPLDKVYESIPDLEEGEETAEIPPLPPVNRPGISEEVRRYMEEAEQERRHAASRPAKKRFSLFGLMGSDSRQQEEEAPMDADLSEAGTQSEPQAQEAAGESQETQAGKAEPAAAKTAAQKIKAIGKKTSGKKAAAGKVPVKKIVGMVVALGVILVVLIQGVRYLKYVTTPRAKVPTVSMELYDKGMELIQSHVTDEYRAEIVQLYQQDTSGAAATARQQQELDEIQALLNEDQSGIHLRLEAETTSQSISGPGPVTFTLHLYNEGDLDIRDVMLSEQSNGDIKRMAVLAPGETQLEQTYQLTQSGTFVFVAQVSDGQGGSLTVLSNPIEIEVGSGEAAVVASPDADAPPPTQAEGNALKLPENPETFRNMMILAGGVLAIILILALSAGMRGRKKRMAQRKRAAVQRKARPRKEEARRRPARHMPPVGVADKPDEMGDTQRFHMGQHRPTDIS